MKKLSIKTLGSVSPYCKGNKNCPGFLIEYENDKIMLDCGNGCTRELILPNDLINLKIFISHLHVDHYGDLLSIFQAALVYKRLGYIDNNIDIYIPISNSVDYEYLKNFELLYPINIHGYKNIDMSYNNIKIKTINVPHLIKTFAFKIITDKHTIVYSADTGNSFKLKEFAEGADLFICESTFLRGQKRVDNVHLYAYEAAQIAANAKVKKLLLTHFWPEIEKEKYLLEAKEIFENTEVAIEGKKILLRR